MSWAWFRNVDGEKILRDEVVICNTAKGMSVSCGRKGSAASSKLSKMNPARGSNWPKRLAYKAHATAAETTIDT
jgi:hypothetical protein